MKDLTHINREDLTAVPLPEVAWIKNVHCQTLKFLEIQSN